MAAFVGVAVAVLVAFVDVLDMEVVLVAFTVTVPAVTVTPLQTILGAAYALTLASAPGPCVCPAIVFCVHVECTSHVAVVVSVRWHPHCSRWPEAERLMSTVLGPAVTVCGTGPLMMQAGMTLLGRLVMAGQARA